MENSKNQRPNFIVVTGLSGAGKSSAMKCFEDQGYYCVDNLPPVLIPELAKICHNSNITDLAVALDIRSRDFFEDLPDALEQTQKIGYIPCILFLEASTDVLIQRYAESRRQHPLAPNNRVENGIQKEKECLKYIRDKANVVLDTSKCSKHQLRGRLFSLFNSSSAPKSRIHIMSFGFKYGMPLDVDLVFDCRFLPNPYYIQNLRHLSGLDQPVRDYLRGFDTFETFSEKVNDLLLFVVPQYFKEGKQQVNVAFGCTGGRHRSVALAEMSALKLRSQNYEVTAEHRDIERSKSHLIADPDSAEGASIKRQIEELRRQSRTSDGSDSTKSEKAAR